MEIPYKMFSTGEFTTLFIVRQKISFTGGMNLVMGISPGFLGEVPLNLLDPTNIFSDTGSNDVVV